MLKSNSKPGISLIGRRHHMSRNNAEVLTLPFTVEVGSWYNCSMGKRLDNIRIQVIAFDEKKANVKGRNPNIKGNDGTLGTPRYFHKRDLRDAKVPGLSEDQTEPEIVTVSPAATTPAATTPTEGAVVETPTEGVTPADDSTGTTSDSASDTTTDVVVETEAEPEAEAEVELTVVTGGETSEEVADEPVAAVA